MTVDEFIKKYNGNNFRNYIKKDATIDYWTELILTYLTDRIGLSDIDLFRVRFICTLDNKPFAVGFEQFCDRQIEILKTQERYKLMYPNDTKPNPSKTESYHTNIFKGGSFEIWQKMFDEFEIKKNKRTDLDFMFSIMKYDNLIHKNIGLIDMQNWINTEYQMTIDKLKHTDPRSKANEKRMTIYNLINTK